MTRSLFAMCLLAGVVTLCGCSWAPGSAEPDPIPDSAYPQVVTMYGLHDKFFYSAPSVRPEENGRPMSVSVPVRLRRSKYDIPCQYRFFFFDPSGRPLDPEPTWQYKNIPPRVQVFLEGSAPDIGAVSWRCEIRPDRVERLR